MRFHILVLFSILVFFSLSLFSGAYFSPADILQMWSPFSIPGVPYTPRNVLLSDIVTQIHPWLKFSHEQILGGSFPLWNPCSGAGVPHFANLQSAVLFPLNCCFYILPWKIALVAAAFLKLSLIALSTYLYLRSLGLNRGGATFGSVNFAFLGFNVFWLQWPLSSVMIFFPLLLFLIEQFLRQSPPGRWPSLLVALSVALAALAGHIETLIHVLLIALAYLLWRLLSGELSWDQCRRRLACFLLFSAIGLGLAAVQLIPFLEYLFLSTAYTRRAAYAANPHYLPLPAAILNLIPDFYGNPSHASYFAPFTNYCVSVGGFAGVTTVILSLLAILSPQRKNRFVWFYLILGALCFCVIYRREPIYRILTAVPFLDIADNSRLLFCLGFSLCVIGAFSIHSITENGARPPRAAAVIGLAALVLAAAVTLAVCNKAFFEAHHFQFRFRHNLEPTILFLACIVVTSLILLRCRYGLLTGRRAALYLGLLMFAQTGVHAIGFNPAIPESQFYPTSPSLRFLQRDQSVHRCLFMGDLFFPDLSAWYGIQEPRNYDAMGIGSYGLFQSALGNFENLFQVVTSVNEEMASFLNVKYIMCAKDQDPRRAMRVRYPERYRCAYADRSVRIFENLSCMPRAFLVPRVRVVGSGDEVLKELPGLDFRSEALVTDRDVPLYHAGGISNSSCAITRYAPREISIIISAERPCYLVLSDNYFPGWRAYVDDREVTIYRANGSFRLVAISTAGDHNLRFYYSPSSFKIGVAISLISVLIAVFASARCLLV